MTELACVEGGWEVGSDMAKAERITPAILLGGSGSRLWPLSRPEKPKQFLVLQGKESLFQNTLRRVQHEAFSPTWLLANEVTLHLAEQQLNEINASVAGIVVEQDQIGTAAAIAALLLVLGNQSDDLILILPSDHIVSRSDLFQTAIITAAPLARAEKIVTFGIAPTAPETGFGYVRPSEKRLSRFSHITHSLVEPSGFVEKPDIAAARDFMTLGYLWNAGIFLFSAKAMRREFETHAPEIMAAVADQVRKGSTEIKNGIAHHNLGEGAAHILAAKQPIDKAIMEKSANIALVPCHGLGWRDMGSLAAIQKLEDDRSNGVV